MMLFQGRDHLRLIVSGNTVGVSAWPKPGQAETEQTGHVRRLVGVCHDAETPRLMVDLKPAIETGHGFDDVVLASGCAKGKRKSQVTDLPTISPPPLVQGHTLGLTNAERNRSAIELK